MPDNQYQTPSPGPLGNKNFGADFNSATATRPFTLTTEAGVIAAYLWVSSGKLYAKFSNVAPANATDGVVVGTQT